MLVENHLSLRLILVVYCLSLHFVLVFLLQNRNSRGFLYLLLFEVLQNNSRAQVSKSWLFPLGFSLVHRVDNRYFLHYADLQNICHVQENRSGFLGFEHIFIVDIRFVSDCIAVHFFAYLWQKFLQPYRRYFQEFGCLRRLCFLDAGVNSKKVASK